MIQPSLFSTSAEPDAMGNAVAECGPSERAVQDKSVSPQQGNVTAQALPTATAEGSPISQKTSARGLGDGAASSSSGETHAEIAARIPDSGERAGQPAEAPVRNCQTVSGATGLTSSNPLSASEPSPLEIRLSKKHLIHQFFQANLGRKFSSYEMHTRWGSAFRSRTSEINRDKDLAISILNETKTIEGQEHSYYWSALR